MTLNTGEGCGETRHGKGRKRGSGALACTPLDLHLRYTCPEPVKTMLEKQTLASVPVDSK